jgi:Xaa-Pro aminopeptidase
MKAHDIDILILSRGANVVYVSGAVNLWNAGTHPFMPACVFVRSTGAIHMLALWDDEGIPADIPRENLVGLKWNPMTVVEVLRGIEGAADARRVATDTISPTFAQLLPMAFPAAELVDGEPAMRAARRIKTPDELAAIRESVAVAGSSLAEAVSELRPGATEKHLAGVLLEAAAVSGVMTPAVQDAAWVTSPEHPWRRVGASRGAASGDLVAFSAAVVVRGYIGEVGRTYQVGGDPDGPAKALYARSGALWERLISACRPGAPASALMDAYEAAGEPLPPMPAARGLGLGFDPPVVTAGLPATAAGERLEPGMVLALTAYTWEPGVGAVFRRDSVAITDGGPELLSADTAVPGS